MVYTKAQLVRVAKRKNNEKRKYLVLNTMQGKHMPAEPGKMIRMCKDLAEKIRKLYSTETLLLIGFAETATAVGSVIAAELNCLCMQTTRENIPDVEYFHFTESHSHAVEQKLIKTDFDLISDQIRRIIFIDDEVTTGNTIQKLINEINKSYPDRFKFAVASVLNGMEKEAEDRFKKDGIDINYLVKTNHSEYTAVAEKYKDDGICLEPDFSIPRVYINRKDFFAGFNPRKIHSGGDYEKSCENLWQHVKENMDFKAGENILVIGTEEFMYPAVYIGGRIEGCRVITHSTTRSPISVSIAEDYPLQSRCELVSFYEDYRTTFIYNLDKYDKVLIITDAWNYMKKGECSLVNALYANGNRDITLIRWFSNEDYEGESEK